MGTGRRGIINLKFLGTVSFAILIVGLLGSAGQAQASIPSPVVWTGDGDGVNWSDAANWLSGVKPTQNDCCGGVINIFGNGVTVHLDENFAGFFVLNIGEGVTLIIDSEITMTHNGFDIPATINNDGTLVVEVGGILDNRGTLNNNGIIINNGDIDNDFSFSFLSNDGVINNNGDIYVGGGAAFNNNISGTVNNNVDGFIGIGNFGSSSLNNFGVINNDGLIRNDVIINNFGSGVINNNDGGVIENFSFETEANSETIFNFGTINNKVGGLINNDFGHINNFVTGLILNEGVILNGADRTIENEGIIINECGGVITGNDPIDTDGGRTYVGSCVAEPGILFGSAFIGTSGPSTLYEIDTSTGAATLIGPIGFERCGGMDHHPTLPLMFAVCERLGTAIPVLITIDTSTGAGTEVATTTHSFDLSFRNSDNKLFNFAGPGEAARLNTVDIITGTQTLVGVDPTAPGNGMAFSLTDDLFHWNIGILFPGSSGGFTTLDQTTGAILKQISSNPPPFPAGHITIPRINALDVQPGTGIMFASVNNGGGGGFGGGPRDNHLGTIDLTTGVITHIGPTVDGLDAIAFSPGDVFVVSKSTNGGDEEPPTIGMNYDGTKLIVTCGVNFDGKCFTITSPYHEEFKLYEMMSGTHTISITMYCAQGVQTCNYAAIAVMPYSESMNGNTTWKIELSKDFEGNLTLVKTDPEGFLGTITYTTSMGDQFWIVSFTIDFKNKDTGPLKFAVQARDDNGEVRNWELNEGVEFKDSDAYPSIETAFEDSLEIDSLCLNEDPTYRYSCAFAEIRDQAILNAEETLRQMENGEYRYK